MAHVETVGGSAILDGSIASSHFQDGAIEEKLGVTSSAAELNILDGVTATATEINKLAAVTAGTNAASKALVVGTHKQLDVVAVANSGLKLGASSSSDGTAVTAQAGELNLVDGMPASATFTVGGEAAHVIVTTVQLKDAADTPANLGSAYAVLTWLSDAAAGAVCAVNVTTSALGGSGAVKLTDISSIVGGEPELIKTGATGSFTVTTTNATAKTVYLNVLLPNGKIVSSGAIAHAG